MDIYPQYRKWPDKIPCGDGILVGSDLAQEWLLPWWWDNYRKHNDHPVTWVDLGMTEKMRDWCRERGELIRLLVADIFVAPQEEVSPENTAYWQEHYGTSFWACRDAWFKKPAAFLQTPYQRTIWIDSDCEVRGPLTPLFDYADHPSGISLCEDLYPLRRTPPVYNSGVVVYRWGLPLITTWAKLAFDKSAHFMGDQDILSKAIHDHKIDIVPFSGAYNRSRRDPEEGAIVVHFHGSNGKKMIQAQLICSRLDDLNDQSY
jgi:hypothetical protein